MIIGITGYARSGKDTIGQYLVENKGFTRVAFADAVRDAVYTLNPEIFEGEYYDARCRSVKDIVDKIGWDRAKTEWPEIRRLLQVMGTEVGRMLFGPNVWVNIADKKMLELADYVITDVRFANEAEFIHSVGGIVVKVERQGVKAVNTHSSEVLDFEVDFTVPNNGSLEDLYTQVDQLLI